ncbi:MAG: phosphoribosylaminoimidazolesuccinocarboxamide synthase, partial [Burkholderiales bacterium]|nr:phosphoribosylaminoimidazolesuccinocarboxamide synthase [Burkholderiales bacterium]
MQKRDFLYEGKAKQVYTTDDQNLIIIRYKDDATAFNNLKKGTIQDKGIINNQITTRLFELLHENGIKTHFHQRLNEREQLCDRVNIIPLEVITRNLIAGSMAKRLNIVEGTKPANLVMELSYKNDELGDPLINDHHAVAL